ncbi:MAG: shikimate dehydrogenase [Victivallaceae bacterium]
MDDFLVIGNPIEHSLSPVMQNAALEMLSGGKLHYGRRRVELDELPEFVEYARKNLRGFNITVPFKQAIMPLLDEISPEAELAHSVNTVVVENGRLGGYSTDGYGLSEAVKSAFKLEIGGGSFMFLGCGGAVWATATYLAQLGAKRIYLINRTLGNAQKLCDLLKQAFPALEVGCAATTDSDKIGEFMLNCQVVFQGSSLGLRADDPPVIDYNLLQNVACFDFIYHETPFLRYAGAHNLPASDGRDMLLYQGARSLSFWLKRDDIPIAAMRRALYAALDNQTRN